MTKIVVGQNIEQKKFAGIIKRNSEAAIFNTEATIKYGIRLDKITNKDVFVKGDSISLILPPVEILNFSYPHEKFVELYPLSNFNRLKKNKATFEDLDKVFRLAEADIRKKVNLLKLKEEAEIKTIKFLELFLTKIGYYNINIEFKEEKKGANS